MSVDNLQTNRLLYMDLCQDSVKLRLTVRYWHDIWRPTFPSEKIDASMMSLGRITHIASFMLALMLASYAHAQTQIGGIVNRYVSVLKVVPCDSLIEVGNAQGFKPGDLVFIIQMKGAVVSKAKDSTSGLIIDLAHAGAAEFLTIESIQGNNITFTTRLANTYDPAGLVQLISVPRYSTARITSPLTCPQWNGTTGGVVVIDVEHDLIMDADITVDGLGFAGGNASSNFQTTEIPDWISNWVEGRAGEKGESIALIPGFLPIAARGRWANGGGGGNGGNAGGAGGSNGGSGGHGGRALVYNRQYPNVGGEPGVVLDSATRKYGRLFMGGGGGGGHQNDGLGTAGGNGGGLVVLKAERVIPRGHKISANGLSSRATISAEKGDGTGGGGAGGTVLLDVQSITAVLTITATGGNSGDINAMYNAHGPGGGGGGGTVICVSSQSNLSINVGGGIPGRHNNPTNEDYLGSWGAQPGRTGVVLDSFAWNKPLSIGLQAWGGGPFCGTQTVELHATPGFASYLWSNGATTPTISVNTPGNYTLTAIDPSGCAHTAGPVRAWENSPQYSLSATLDFGTVDYKRKYIKIVPLTNTDDEDIVVAGISSAPNFSILAPNSFPIVVPAGKSINIVIQLFTNEVRDYHEVFTVEISSPCPDTGTIAVDAIINVVHATYTAPDTTAPVGVTGYGIPITVRLEPDTLVLPNTHMLLSVRFDSRIFAPSLVTQGRIVGDVIDVVASTRTLTIEFDSVDIVGPEMTLTSVIGTILNSYVSKSILDIVSVEYLEVFQMPVDSIDDGSLHVAPVCFQFGRQVKLYGNSSARVVPNPATDGATAQLEMSAPGNYVLTITDVTGALVEQFEFVKSNESTEVRAVNLNTATLPSGLYSVAFTSPLTTTISTLIINR